MQEEFGAIFGYNYRRRILINIRNRQKRLREKHLLMIREQKLVEERKKREAIVLRNYFEKEKEKNVVIIPEYEEPTIEDKLQLAEILKEGLVILLQELKLIRAIEIKKGIKDSISTDLLIKEIQEDIENLNYIKGDNEITPEELGIILDILYDNTIESIIESKKKNIGLNLDKSTLTNWIEFDKEVNIYDEFIKGTIDELKDVDKKLDNKLLKEEDIRPVIDKSFNKCYKVLMTLSIATKKERPIDRIIGINMGLSLMRDLVNPNIQVKDYSNYSIKNYTRELERCYMDPSYCRLYIIDSKRMVYEISKELRKQKNSLEYQSVYNKLGVILKELDNQEYELTKMINSREKSRVYIKEMEEYE